MSNTIRRPRRRPRVESINFRTLWWLVAREAAYRVTASWWYIGTGRLPLTRLNYAGTRVRWRQRAQQLLRAYESLRFLP